MSGGNHEWSIGYSIPYSESLSPFEVVQNVRQVYPGCLEVDVRFNGRNYDIVVKGPLLSERSLRERIRQLEQRLQKVEKRIDDEDTRALEASEY